MSIDELILALLSAPIFTGLEPPQLKSLALLAETVAFDDGEDLIRDGELGDAAFVVASGSVAVHPAEIGDDSGIVLGAGTVVGELAMFVDTTHSATVTAIGEVHTLRIERSALLEAMAADPALAEGFVEVMRRRLDGLAVRLRETDQRLDLDSDRSWQPAASLH